VAVLAVTRAGLPEWLEQTQIKLKENSSCRTQRIMTKADQLGLPSTELARQFFMWQAVITVAFGMQGNATATQT
tara:strand:- start:1347 stop:1568 length:222 start_codon:yes stop_codon:yes gene_type:complete